MMFSEMQFKFWWTLNKSMQQVSSIGFLAGNPLKEEKRFQLQWEHKEFMSYVICVENLKIKVKNLE